MSAFVIKFFSWVIVLLNTRLLYGIILLSVFHLIQIHVYLLAPSQRLHILCSLPVLQCGGHWVSLYVTNSTRRSMYIRITLRRGAFAWASLLCRSNKCYIFAPINYRSPVREHMVASGVIPHYFLIHFYNMFALVTELYLRTCVGCSPTEEGSGNGSIVVWRISVGVIVVLCVCGQS